MPPEVRFTIKGNLIEHAQKDKHTNTLTISDDDDEEMEEAQIRNVKARFTK